MRKYIILLICICIPFPLYSQNIQTIEKSTIDVASKIGESVVSISSVVKEKVGRRFYFNSPFDDFQDSYFQGFFEEFFGSLPEREYKRVGLGSGIIIDKDGYILTNEHVISGASQVKVKLSDGREFNAEIKGTDKRRDLAVIKIDAKKLPVAKLGNSNNLKIGQWVIAVGNPFGFAIGNPEPTVTVGVISALHRYLPALGRRKVGYDDLIQTDAAINPGNSGGPLVNLEGKVIGINTAIISTSGGYQGLGFAIPINRAKRILSKLVKGEKVLYGWLGVNIQDLNDDLRNYFGIKERKGVIVLKVYKDSPAEKSGLKEGDLILSFGNQPVKTTRDIVTMVSYSEVGSIILFRIVRSGEAMTIRVKIGKLPTGAQESRAKAQNIETYFRGLTVDNISAVYKRKFRFKTEEGVVIIDIEDGSLADKSGLRIGDVILKIEKTKIRKKEDFKFAISRIKGSCLLKTNRGFFVVKSDFNR